MTAKIKLKLKKRTLTGRKLKALRRQGILPANIYGKDIKSLAVQLPVQEFKSAFDQAGETNIVELKVHQEAKPRPALITNIHLHPVTGSYLHADFHQVDLTKKVTVDIPIQLVGEAPAVAKGGVLLQLLNEISVEALPNDLPDKFTVDISQLNQIGQGISLKDIKFDTAKVKLLADNPEELIVKIEEPAKEEEKPEPAVADEAAEPSPEAEAPTPDQAKSEEKDQEDQPAQKTQPVKSPQATEKGQPNQDKKPVDSKSKPSKAEPKPSK